MGWAVLAEVPPAPAIAGGGLCIGGVIVARSGGGLRLRLRQAPVEGYVAKPANRWAMAQSPR
jgi:hypothetical protein